MKSLPVMMLAGLFGSVAGVGSIVLTPLTPEQEAARAKVEASVYYAGCDEVRLLGKAPIYEGQPGYRSGMDGDNDGIACEPYHGN